jgi:hypothetical protein
LAICNSSQDSTFTSAAPTAPVAFAPVCRTILSRPTVPTGTLNTCERTRNPKRSGTVMTTFRGSTAGLTVFACSEVRRPLWPGSGHRTAGASRTCIFSGADRRGLPLPGACGVRLRYFNTPAVRGVFCNPCGTSSALVRFSLARPY